MLPLHEAALAEAQGVAIAGKVTSLLQQDFDPHETDEDGNTAFNIAAPSSPVCGGLMTNHWLKLALEGKGSKGLNDRSGAHGSTLAQYIAKWSGDNEIEKQIADGVAKGMIIDAPNASGWTPLTAAAAMGRVKAVAVFARNYSASALLERTTEEYKASYQGHVVIYAAGLAATGVAAARLAQDKGLTEAQKKELTECIRILKGYVS